jgi:hypothetical protein
MKLNKHWHVHPREGRIYINDLDRLMYGANTDPEQRRVRFIELEIILNDMLDVLAQYPDDKYRAYLVKRTEAMLRSLQKLAMIV